MIMDVLELARKNIRDLRPYSTARDEFAGEAPVMLDANENPFNAPLNRYPDPHQMDIKKRIARLKQTVPDRIFLGNGSDEAIDLLFRVFCEPGQDNAVSISPTYGMYRVAADINNIVMKEVRLTADFQLDSCKIAEACDENTRLIFLCSPNNPTANLLDRKEVLKVVRESRAVVVIDEAYIDFSGTESMLGELDSYPNMVVLQTFSKAWGLAGIRLGMAFAQPAIISLMNKVKYPYNINLLTRDTVLKALDNESRISSWVETILEQRGFLQKELEVIPSVLKVWPSDANFLLVKFTDPVTVFKELTVRGIIVRDRSSVPLCDGALRITVGTAEENKILLESLKELC